MGKVERCVSVNNIVTSLSSYPHEEIYDEDMHCHETRHLSMVLRGGNVEKRKARQTICLPGTVTYYDAGEVHRSVKIIPNSLQINLEISDEFMLAYDLPIDVTTIESSQPADRQFLMLRIYRDLLLQDTESSLSITSSILRLLKNTDNTGPSHGVPVWVGKIRAALHDKWDETVSLNELSQIAGLHPANLSGYFPRYFGLTIGEYRRKLKVEKALELVKHSPLSISIIAHRAGFADQSHFTRTCKEITGWNPRQIRDMRLQ